MQKKHIDDEQTAAFGSSPDARLLLARAKRTSVGLALKDSFQAKEKFARTSEVVARSGLAASRSLREQAATSKLRDSGRTVGTGD